MRACERAHWQAQRDHAYRLNAVPHVPVADQARTLISILYKPKRDKRRAIFSASVLAAVRARWPDADVEVHDGMSETADAQLAWLSRTSVLITNVGSAGFRLLYLPDGAQVRACPACGGEACREFMCSCSCKRPVAQICGTHARN